MVPRFFETAWHQHEYMSTFLRFFFFIMGTLICHWPIEHSADNNNVGLKIMFISIFRLYLYVMYLRVVFCGSNLCNNREGLEVTRQSKTTARPWDLRDTEKCFTNFLFIFYSILINENFISYSTQCSNLIQAICIQLHKSRRSSHHQNIEPGKIHHTLSGTIQLWKSIKLNQAGQQIQHWPHFPQKVCDFIWFLFTSREKK